MHAVQTSAPAHSCLRCTARFTRRRSGARISSRSRATDAKSGPRCRIAESCLPSHRTSSVPVCVCVCVCVTVRSPACRNTPCMPGRQTVKDHTLLLFRARQQHFARLTAATFSMPISSALAPHSTVVLGEFQKVCSVCNSFNNLPPLMIRFEYTPPPFPPCKRHDSVCK